MPLRYEKKPPSWFKTKKQVREVKDDAELRSLGESMRVKQLQPVVARTDGMLVFGHRRLAASILVGLLTLDVVITDDEMSETQVKLFQLTENVHRADLTAHERWLACSELMGMNPAWQLKDLADALHMDPSSVTRILSPSKCIPEWQSALAAGKVGISECYAASKLEREAQVDLLALKFRGASRDQIVSAGRKTRTNGTPAVKVAKVKCVLSSGVQIVVSGEAISLEGAAEALVEAIKEMKRAKELGYTAKTFAAAMADKARKG